MLSQAVRLEVDSRMNNYLSSLPNIAANPTIDSVERIVSEGRIPESFISRSPLPVSWSEDDVSSFVSSSASGAITLMVNFS